MRVRDAMWWTGGPTSTRCSRDGFWMKMNKDNEHEQMNNLECLDSYDRKVLGFQKKMVLMIGNQFVGVSYSEPSKELKVFAAMAKWCYFYGV